jgi:hypothetical protein
MAFGAGIIPYLATAGVNKEPKSAIRKLSTMLSLDGAAVVGTLFFGVGEAIINLGHSHPELAQHIQNDAKSVKLWYGVAGVLVVAEWLKNRHKGEPTPN